MVVGRVGTADWYSFGIRGCAIENADVNADAEVTGTSRSTIARQVKDPRECTRSHAEELK